MKIILSSKSPRRIELIQKLGIPFEVRPTETDETFLCCRTPSANAVHAAEKKARAAAALGIGKDEIVLAADTVVVYGATVIGKPKNIDDAFDILRALSGKTHEVITGVCMMDNEKIHCFSESSFVEFLPLSDREIYRYIATGEPMDKAGAYGIQGMGGLFVRRINGCFYNVMGLPISAVYDALRNQFGQG